MLLFLSGLQMLMIGVVGEYLARVFDEVKQRPAWVVSRAIGFEISDESISEEPAIRDSASPHVPLFASRKVKRTPRAPDPAVHPLPVEVNAARDLQAQSTCSAQVVSGQIDSNAGHVP